MNYSKEQLVDMYTDMIRARVYEEVTLEKMENGEIAYGAWHMAMGEEAAKIGVIRAIGPDDYLMPNYRCHGSMALMLDMRKFTAECLNKAEGYGKGISSSVHITSIQEDHILPANGVLGASGPIAVGYALALKKQGKPGAVLTICGDSASNEGNFLESLNIAAVMNAPVVFLIENNGIGYSTPISSTCRLKHLSDRAAAFGIEGVTVDGNDVAAVRSAVEAALQKARCGEPSIVELMTFRYRPHSEGISEEPYVLEHLEEAKKNDPIDRMTAQLIQNGMITQERIDEIRAAARKESEDAYEYAIALDYPTREQVTDLNLVYQTLGEGLQ